MLLLFTKNLSQFRHFLGPIKRCAVPCRRHALSMIPFHPCRIPCHNGRQCAGRLPPETIGIEPGLRPKLKEPEPVPARPGFGGVACSHASAAGRAERRSEGEGWAG